MKLLISDEELEELIGKVQEKRDYYWQNNILPFLEGLRGECTVTRQDGNKLNKIREDVERW